MQRRDDVRTGPGWIREALAGATGALTVLPVLLTLGLLAFAPVGAAAPPVALLAVPAGVMLTVALGLAHRWTGRLLARWWAGERSGDMALSLAVVALVVGTTLGCRHRAGCAAVAAGLCRVHELVAGAPALPRVGAAVASPVPGSA